ncbi:MAG: 2-amino-4-hydroxy-6-hydroxymethyldihydropteridine diphosphokinase [Vicingaceae bacterium]
MDKRKNKVVLMLGGNKGDVRNTFNAVYSELNKKGKILKTSALYQTAPWGYGQQNDFYNQAVIYYTNLAPKEVLHFCHSIEQKMGRKRNPNNQYDVRTIDIDIIFYNEEIINEPQLTIPHPKLHLRNFVLIPLNEIIADFKHPKFDKTIKELLKKSTDKLNVEKLQ